MELVTQTPPRFLPKVILGQALQALCNSQGSVQELEIRFFHRIFDSVDGLAFQTIRSLGPQLPPISSDSICSAATFFRWFVGPRVESGPSGRLQFLGPGAVSFLHLLLDWLPPDQRFELRELIVKRNTNIFQGNPDSFCSLMVIGGSENQVLECFGELANSRESFEPLFGSLPPSLRSHPVVLKIGLQFQSQKVS